MKMVKRLQVKYHAEYKPELVTTHGACKREILPGEEEMLPTLFLYFLVTLLIFIGLFLPIVIKSNKIILLYASSQ